MNPAVITPEGSATMAIPKKEDIMLINLPAFVTVINVSITNCC